MTDSSATSKGAFRSPFFLLAPPAKRSVIAFALSVAIAAAWLLPNHYHPWIAFHSDFYLASLLWLMLSWRLVTRETRNFLVSPAAVAMLLLAVICLLQYVFGQTYFHGESVIAAMYFLGAFLAIVQGADLASRNTDLARKFFVSILGAFLVAGILSVGISLYQYFVLTYLEVWVIPSMSARFAANMGQPNQLATLISCSICVGIWLFERRSIGQTTLLILVAWLVAGVLMTQSRTGYLQLAMLALAWCLIASRIELVRRLLLLALLVGWFFAFPYLLGVVASSIGFELPFGSRDLRSDPVRIALWTGMLKAIGNSPWFGFGSSSFHEAYWMATVGDPTLKGLLFGHGHNIFIDLAIWFGVPVTVLVTCALIVWVKRAYAYAFKRQHSALLLILAVIFLHAMLELPLHYAYFLLPFMLLVGYLERRFDFYLFAVRKSVIAGATALAGVLGVVVWFDYIDAEEAFRIFRFEAARIGSVPDAEPSPAILINQWQLVIAASRMDTRSVQNPEDLELMLAATRLQPAPHFFLKTAQLLSLHGKRDEAEQAVKYGCHVNPLLGCQVLIRAWEGGKKSHAAHQ